MIAPDGILMLTMIAFSLPHHAACPHKGPHCLVTFDSPKSSHTMPPFSNGSTAGYPFRCRVGRAAASDDWLYRPVIPQPGPQTCRP